MILKQLISDEEEILWRGKPSKKELKKMKKKIFFLLILIILSTLITCIFIFIDLSYVLFLVVLYLIPLIFISGGFIITYTINYSELKTIEYFVTNEREIDIGGDKTSHYYPTIQTLKFKHIDKIIIIPIKKKKRSIAHFDFYSEVIQNN
ncbi:MAG: hypothetical protein ACTSQG_12060, partial [Promethearchaeota archaeon]